MIRLKTYNLIDKNNETIIPKTEFVEIKNTNIDKNMQLIKEQYYNNIDKIRYKFNRYHKLIRNVNTKIYHNTMKFLIDELNNICVFYILEYKIGLMDNYIKIIIYNPYIYPDKVKKWFNKLIKKKINSDDNKMYLYKKRFDYYKALCIQRNLNMILNEFGYEIFREPREFYIDGHKYVDYNIYTILK